MSPIDKLNKPLTVEEIGKLAGAIARAVAADDAETALAIEVSTYKRIVIDIARGVIADPVVLCRAAEKIEDAGNLWYMGLLFNQAVEGENQYVEEPNPAHDPPAQAEGN
jgi:hypothetical protein